MAGLGASGGPFAPGALVAGKYRLIKPLGEGAMGVVWSAINEGTSGEVALKLIWKPEPDYRTRLLREARACGTIRHKNVIQIHDVGQTDSGDPFLVMELLSGETLGELLARKRRLPPPDACQIARDVARALSAAHGKGIVHRDLKPANIFLHTEPGEDKPVVKVLDFGVAKNLSTNDGLRTAAGGAVGSPMYMSPEQARAERNIDGRADIWSLGVVLFEMLVGERPFKGEIAEVLLQIQDGDLPTVARRVRKIDPDLDAIVAGCLNRDREQRLGPAEEVARRLEAHTGQPSSGRAPLPSLMEEGLSEIAATAVQSGRSPISSGAGAQSLQPVVTSVPAAYASPGLGASLQPSPNTAGPAAISDHGTILMRPPTRDRAQPNAAPEPLRSSHDDLAPWNRSSGAALPRASAEQGNLSPQAPLTPDRSSAFPAPSMEVEADTQKLGGQHIAPHPHGQSLSPSNNVVGPTGTVRVDPEVVAQAIQSRGGPGSLAASTVPMVQSPVAARPAARRGNKRVLWIGVGAALFAASVSAGLALFLTRKPAEPAQVPVAVVSAKEAVTTSDPPVATTEVTASAPPPPAPPTASVPTTSTGEKSPGPVRSTTVKPPPPPQPKCSKFLRNQKCPDVYPSGP